MATSTLLSDVIAEYVKSSSVRDAPNTTVNKKRYLTMLLTFTGNIYVKNITRRHVDDYFTMRQARGLQPSTLNNELICFNHFFNWCARRRYISALDVATSDYKNFKVPQKSRLRVPPEQFGKLLNGAMNERDRIVVALGLYLFLRQGEIRTLTVGDVSLTEKGGWLGTVQHKTLGIDLMPISQELNTELRRWLRFYMLDQRVDELDPSWLLVPAKVNSRWVGVGRRQFAPAPEDAPTLKPNCGMHNMARIAQKALINAGYATHTPQGKSNNEGVHTLRRSGARALFDVLAERGYDGALRAVQAMLHHASSKTTEIYLGLDLDRHRRNALIEGEVMFPNIDTSDTPPADNVFPIRKEA